MKSQFVALSIAAICFAAFSARAESATDPAALSYTKTIRPLLTTYCGKCHGADQAKGDISLAAFTKEDAVQSDPKLWRNVLTQLGDYTMPPKSKPQPTQAERDLLVGYLTHRLNNLDLSKLPKDPGRVTMRRLNRAEYNNTIRDLLGIESRPADVFPADGGGGGGFDNNGDTLFIPPVLMEMYLKAAGEVLAAASDDRIISSKPVAAGKDAKGAKDKRQAARESITAFASRAFRRPVEPAEVDRLMKLFNQADARGATFGAAMRLAAKGTLVSPHFLFRVEKEHPTKDAYEASDYEIASRLSYFVWASMPDAELFALAAQGKLHDDVIIDVQVRRMLKDKKSRSLAEQFGGQWLGFNALNTTAAPDRKKFPAFTPAVRDAMYEEAVEFIDSIYREDRPLLTLIDADYTFVNEPLARFYSIPKITGEEMRKISLKDANRGGVLGLAGVLTATSYPLRTSPGLRGKWVLDTLIGAPPPPPPPDVPKLPDDDAPAAGLTFRQQLEKHRANPACASCHARMDPLGFGLENFDAIGRWRTTDSTGKPVDAVGKLSTGETFTGPRELKKVLLKRKDDFTRAMTEKMLAYALGRGLETYDQAVIKRITDAVMKDGYRSTTLVAEVAKSYPMRWRKN